MPTKPLVFISYAHADEPENPGDGEVKWLTFVKEFLKPAYCAEGNWYHTLWAKEKRLCPFLSSHNYSNTKICS